jgi:hypothetical protein
LAGKGSFFARRRREPLEGEPSNAKNSVEKLL